MFSGAPAHICNYAPRQRHPIPQIHKRATQFSLRQTMLIYARIYVRPEKSPRLRTVLQTFAAHCTTETRALARAHRCKKERLAVHTLYICIRVGREGERSREADVYVYTRAGGEGEQGTRSTRGFAVVSWPDWTLARGRRSPFTGNPAAAAAALALFVFCILSLFSSSSPSVSRARRGSSSSLSPLRRVYMYIASGLVAPSPTRLRCYFFFVVIVVFFFFFARARSH